MEYLVYACPECGAQMAPDSRFCSNHGKTVAVTPRVYRFTTGGVTDEMVERAMEAYEGNEWDRDSPVLIKLMREALEAAGSWTSGLDSDAVAASVGTAMGVPLPGDPWGADRLYLTSVERVVDAVLSIGPR